MTVTHPHWCDSDRCTAANDSPAFERGAHRSMPFEVDLGPTVEAYAVDRIARLSLTKDHRVGETETYLLLGVAGREIPFPFAVARRFSHDLEDVLDDADPMLVGKPVVDRCVYCNAKAPMPMGRLLGGLIWACHHCDRVYLESPAASAIAIHGRADEVQRGDWVSNLSYREWFKVGGVERHESGDYQFVDVATGELRRDRFPVDRSTYFFRIPEGTDQ